MHHDTVIRMVNSILRCIKSRNFTILPETTLEILCQVLGLIVQKGQWPIGVRSMDRFQDDEWSAIKIYREYLRDLGMTGP